MSQMMGGDSESAYGHVCGLFPLVARGWGRWFLCRFPGSAGSGRNCVPPVTPEELAWLVYDVAVLTEPEPIDSPDQLDVKRYGVIVQCGERRGLLLPDLPGVDSVSEQIAIARRKGNIDEWEAYQLWRFEVERHV